MFNQTNKDAFLKLDNERVKSEPKKKLSIYFFRLNYMFILL